jgi:hypothetical protein
MRRNKSLPPEQMEKLPEIVTSVKKDNLVQLSMRAVDLNKKEQPSALAIPVKSDSSINI